MQLNCVNDVVHMEGCLIGVTKIHGGYTWRLTGNATKKCTSNTWNIARNLKLNFVKNLSTPWHGAVDQEWMSKMCVPNHASQPPDRSALALLSVPNWSGKSAP